MCGISGIFSSRRPVERHDVELMAATMDHRGPDNRGSWESEHCVLGHNRLSLLDLSARANQPFGSGRFKLTYNGEIYNFRSIRSDLEQSGYEFTTTSDTEVLYSALNHYGVRGALDRIEGMFAFGYYDVDQKRLYLARDRLGIKPLFYGVAPNGACYFASEVKAILSVLNPEPDIVKIAYSTICALENSRCKTAFRGVQHVPPGGVVECEGESLREEIYFRVGDLLDRDLYRQLAGSSVDAVVKELDSRLSDSVEKMLVSDAPMGVFVSGGIDSSLIAQTAAKNRDSLDLFTADVVGPHSEYKGAQDLARSIKAELNAYRFEPAFFLRDWVQCTWHNEAPIILHVNAVPFSNVARLARHSSVKAVLTGEGSDELFLGYPSLLTRRFDRLIGCPYQALDWLYGRFGKLKSYWDRRRGSSMSSLYELAAQNFTRQVIREEEQDRYSFLPERERYEHYLTIQMLCEGLVALLWRNDRMGMTHSIESRFPFLDEEVLKFAMSLPVKFKISRSLRFHNYKHPFLIDKWIVRQAALHRGLPKSLVFKQKQGFPLHGLETVSVDERVFEGGFVAWLFDLSSRELRYLSEKVGRYEIGKLTSLEIWGRLFVFREKIEEVQSRIDRWATVDVKS